MGLSAAAAAWWMAGITAASGIATNVRANRASKPKVAPVLKAPDSSLKDERDDEVNLGSDRARMRNRRASGRKQLMAPQGTTSSSTGLQI